MRSRGRGNFCAGDSEDDGEAAALVKEVEVILMQNYAAIKDSLDSAAKDPSYTCLLTQGLGVSRKVSLRRDGLYRRL